MGLPGKSPQPLKVKTRRGNGKHGKMKTNHEQIFSVWGNNSNGLKAKIKSLKANIEHFQRPSCITIQETKLRQRNIIKIEGYKVFEKQRTGFGGGLLTAVLNDLHPVLVGDGDDDNEVLVIQVQVGKYSVRVFNCYGPQEDEDYQKKVIFWNTLEKDVISAINQNCYVLIQMDGNAKVGANVIKADPNKQSENGALLIDLLHRQNLHLLNLSDRCQGTITRHRETIHGVEKSILDYVIVCPGLYSHFVEMVIDEGRLHTLTKYASTKGCKRKVESDHNSMFCKFSIKFQKEKIRKEMVCY